MRQPDDSPALQLSPGQSCAVKEELSVESSATDSAWQFHLLTGFFFSFCMGS